MASSKPSGAPRTGESRSLLSAGYSAKSLPDKLGFKAGQVAAFVALPHELAGLATSAQFAAVSRVADWSKRLPAKRFDVIHAFTVSRAEVEARLAVLQAAIKPDGMIWVSWPKKAAKVATDVTEDVIRNAALALDLVDVKVAAVDHKWSGLKLVIRKARR